MAMAMGESDSPGTGDKKGTGDDKMFLMGMFTGCIYTETESNGLLKMVMMNCYSLGSR